MCWTKHWSSTTTTTSRTSHAARSKYHHWRLDRDHRQALAGRFALGPDQRADTRFVHTLTNGRDRYQTDIRGGAYEIPPGGDATFESKVFAGAKEVHLLDRYAEEQGITNFDLAVDFGWLFFLTKPFFYALDYIYRAVGNSGSRS